MEVDFVDADEFAAIEMALQQAAARKAANAATNQQQSGPSSIAGGQHLGAQQQRSFNHQPHNSQQHTQLQANRPASSHLSQNPGSSQHQNRSSQQTGQTSIGSYFTNKGSSSAPLANQSAPQTSQVLTHPAYIQIPFFPRDIHSSEILPCFGPVLLLCFASHDLCKGNTLKRGEPAGIL
jgi:hypothetical protein